MSLAVLLFLPKIQNHPFDAFFYPKSFLYFLKCSTIVLRLDFFFRRSIFADMNRRIINMDIWEYTRDVMICSKLLRGAHWRHRYKITKND